MKRPKNQQCNGKKRFATSKEARAAKHLSPIIGVIDVYKCPHCRKWHYGHRPAAKKRGFFTSTA